MTPPNPLTSRLTDEVLREALKARALKRNEILDEHLGRSVVDVDFMTDVAQQGLEAMRAVIVASLRPLLKDLEFHADCRPNRQQAEAWRDALERIVVCARRAYANGHPRGTPVSCEDQVKFRDRMLGDIIAFCNAAGVTSSLLREAAAPLVSPPGEPPTIEKEPR